VLALWPFGRTVVKLDALSVGTAHANVVYGAPVQ